MTVAWLALLLTVPVLSGCWVSIRRHRNSERRLERQLGDLRRQLRDTETFEARIRALEEDLEDRLDEDATQAPAGAKPQSEDPYNPLRQP